MFEATINSMSLGGAAQVPPKAANADSGQNPNAMISGESATVRSSITPTKPIISSSPSPKLRPQHGCRSRRPTVVPSIYVGSLDAMAAIASRSHRCAASFSQRLCHAWTNGKLLSWNGSSPHCRLPWPKSSMLRLAARQDEIASPDEVGRNRQVRNLDCNAAFVAKTSERIVNLAVVLQRNTYSHMRTREIVLER